MKIKIPNAEVQHLLTQKEVSFPRYTTQIMNLANSNAQGTRPKIVGQMSNLIQEFEGNSFKEWEIWYKERYPDAIENATDKIFEMVEQFKKNIELIDRNLIYQWVEDLVLNKTFAGLNFQEAILRKVAESRNTTYRLSTKEEESKGIDGYIETIPVSIKPLTYLAKMTLSESIAVSMIFYDKKKDGIVIEFDF
jgi:polyribonucleotide nucleotidyltransferase